MDKILIIAEKDSLAKQIATALVVKKRISDNNTYYYESDEFIIAAASGHLLALLPDDEFKELPYIPKKYNTKPILKKIAKLNLLKKLAKRPDVVEICNACDPGREGELIGSLIYEYLDSSKSYTRLWANTQTPQGIRKEFEKRKSENEYKNLLLAAKARNEADFLIGINTTKCLLELMKKKQGDTTLYTAGRVKTPTIALICDLEQAILNFTPKVYYEIQAKLVNPNGITLICNWKKEDSDFEKFDCRSKYSQDELEITSNDSDHYRIYDKKIAEEIQQKCLEEPICLDISVSEVFGEESSPSLFDITDLIAEANKKFKFPVETIIKDLQILYENGFVTYPRSESKYLGDDAYPHIIEVFKYLSLDNPLSLTVLENDWIKPNNKVFNTEKLIDGHSAIIPDIPSPDNNLIFTDTQQQLYQLIIKRLIMKFYPNAEYKNTIYKLNINNENFQSISKSYIEFGWKKLLDEDDNKENTHQNNLRLCEFDIEKAQLQDVIIVDKVTFPPKRITLGQLPRFMKSYNLGTAATRASIISDLLAKNDAKRVSYFRVENNIILPTTEAQFVIDFLRKHNINSITQPSLTANWEQQLNDISTGNLQPKIFLDSVKHETCNIVEQFKKELNSLPEYKKVLGFCPQCHHELIDVGNKNIVCTECKFSFWKIFGQKSLTIQQMRDLLNPEKGYKTELISGFISQTTKKKYNAQLKLEPTQNWRVIPVFDHKNLDYSNIKVEKSVNQKETEFICPECGKKLILVMSDKKYLSCSSSQHKFKLRLIIAGRAFCKKEIHELLTNNSLKKTQGFISKQGKPFTAGLKLLQDGNVEFVFDKK